MKFFKNKITDEYYFETKDQSNLISVKNGTEFYLSEYYQDDFEVALFKEVSLDEVLKFNPYFNIEKVNETT